MNLNITLRVVGLVVAFVILTLAGVLPAIAFVLAFLSAMTLHYISDLEGDAFFTDEPLFVAVLRHTGVGIIFVLGVFGLLLHFPIWALVVSFLGGLGIHLWGDILSVKDNLMAFDLSKDVVIYPFLGWVGLKIADGAILGMASGHPVAKWFMYAAIAIAETALYAAYRIYRDGNDSTSFNPDPAPKA